VNITTLPLPPKWVLGPRILCFSIAHSLTHPIHNFSIYRLDSFGDLRSAFLVTSIRASACSLLFNLSYRSLGPPNFIFVNRRCREHFHVLVLPLRPHLLNLRTSRHTCNYQRRRDLTPSSAVMNGLQDMPIVILLRVSRLSQTRRNFVAARNAVMVSSNFSFKSKGSKAPKVATSKGASGIPELSCC